MAQSMKIADFFSEIGFRVNFRELDKLEQRLDRIKSKLDSMRGSAGRTTIRTGGGGGGGGGGVGARAGAAAGVGAGIGASGGLGLGGLAVGGGLAAAGLGLFQAQGQLIGIKQALLAVTGGQQEANEEFERLKNLSNEIPFNLNKTARAYTNLLAAGKSVNFSTQETRKSFESIVSAARVLNLSTDDTVGALRAVQQMMSKGTVMAEELKGQLGERLPGAVGLAAKAMGISVQELFKRLERGEVLAKDLIPKLSDEILKMANANGALEKASANLNSKFIRLQNTFFEASATIAQGGFTTTVGAIFDRLSDLLKTSTKDSFALNAAISLLLFPLNAAAEAVQSIVGAAKATGEGPLIALAGVITALGIVLGGTKLGRMATLATLVSQLVTEIFTGGEAVTIFDEIIDGIDRLIQKITGGDFSLRKSLEGDFINLFEAISDPTGALTRLQNFGGGLIRGGLGLEGFQGNNVTIQQMSFSVPTESDVPQATVDAVLALPEG